MTDTTLNREPGSRCPTDVDRQIGVNVRALRVERGFTLQEMGASLGMSHQQLQKYETGTNRMSGGTIAAAAAVLGVDIPTLFQGPDDLPARAVIPLKVTRRLQRMQAELDTLLAEVS